MRNRPPAPSGPCKDASGAAGLNEAARELSRRHFAEWSQVTRPVQFRFQLFIAEHTLNSALAITNLRQLCAAHLAGRHAIEIVDVLREPERALAAGVVMTPMLLKVFPSPEARIVGTLSRTSSVLQALGLVVRAA